jgi:predicted nucleic acid-binding protein
MIVLDANILIRAVLGKRVRQLLETYAVRGVRFYAPEVAYATPSSVLVSLSDVWCPAEYGCIEQ